MWQICRRRSFRVFAQWHEQWECFHLSPFVVDTPIFYPDLDGDDTEGIAKRKQAMGAWFDKLAVKPEVVGEQVLRAIQTNKFYIFCDGVESRDMIKRRAQGMLDAFDRQFPQ